MTERESEIAEIAEVVKDFEVSRKGSGLVVRSLMEASEITGSNDTRANLAAERFGCKVEELVYIKGRGYIPEYKVRASGQLSINEAGRE